jgi:hypothetical protein
VCVEKHIPGYIAQVRAGCLKLAGAAR